MTKMIPCHLIAGPLGVGKTTTILNYLKANAAREFIAVLTNDFGTIGLDSAILGGEAGGDNIKLVNVPGGCICCTSFQSLELGLEQIAALPRVDRVIVEPSGLTMLNQLCPMLEKLCIRFGFEWRPVIVLIDPGRVKKPQIENLPYFEQLVHHADILVANRCDRNKPEAMEQFLAWAHAWTPPKLKIITTSHGELPHDVFELRKDGTTPVLSRATVVVAAPRLSRRSVGTKAEAASLVQPASHGDATTPIFTNRYHVHAQSGGEKWDKNKRFSAEALIKALYSEGIQRFKGIFSTDQGWRLIEWASGEIHNRAVAPSDASRAEWILDHETDRHCFEETIRNSTTEHTEYTEKGGI